MVAFTRDTSFGTLLDHPQAKQVFDKHFAGITANPLVKMLRGMTLNNRNLECNSPLPYIL
jgi:hypothetical protein